MKSKIEDLTGDIIGELTVLRYIGGQFAYWLCQCTCGIVKNIQGGALRLGKAQLPKGARSCGCLRSRTAHRMYNHPLYSRWFHIKERCTSIQAKDYSRYGGRGITMDLWFMQHPYNFIRYIEIRHPNWQELLKHKYQIDRINNDNGYEPGNIRLTTPKINSNNRRQRAQVNA